MSDQQPSTALRVWPPALSEQILTRMTEMRLEGASQLIVTQRQDKNKHENTQEPQHVTVAACKVENQRDIICEDDDIFKSVEEKTLRKIMMINNFRTMTKTNKMIPRKKEVKRLRISPRLMETKEEKRKMGERSVI